MNRDLILTRLREIEPHLRARGVAALYLFGSYARDEATASSDVDVFVDPKDEDFLRLEPFMAAYDDIPHGVRRDGGRLRHAQWSFPTYPTSRGATGAQGVLMAASKTSIDLLFGLHF